MTLHVRYNHQCGRCGAYYIPYDKDVPCPKCDLIEEERFNFIPQAVESIMYNLKSYGSYVPPAWWTGSLGDHILHLLFMIFERFEMSRENDFDSFIKKELSKLEWGDQKYLENHIYGIAVRINDELKKQKIKRRR